MKRQIGAHLSDAQFAVLVRRLIEEGEIAEALYDLACGQAYLILEKRRIDGSGDLKEESHSLAVDCLLELRTKRKTYVQSAGHLAHELSKYLTRRESPAFHEVWKALSHALLELETERQVERISPSGGVNSQTTEWCLAGSAGLPPASLENFFEGASALPIYRPARKDGRLLAPAQARDLALSMLKLAGGPILMQGLHGEAMKHVIVQMLYPESIDGEVEKYGEKEGVTRLLADRMPVNDFILQEEAQERARQIWDRLEKSKDGKPLCMYFIPKYLLGAKVTGKDMGDSSRNSEAAERIRKAFRDAIDLTPTRGEREEAAAMDQRAPSGSEFAAYKARLLGRIAEILMTFCSEKSWDSNLKINEDEP